MKTQKFQNREEWLQARTGKITGTVLKDIITLRGTAPKKGFYQLIADRVALPADGENAMDRGVRLEPEAMERFMKQEKKKVDTSLMMWISEENESMAISPDGVIGETGAVEVKCLNSASHIEAWLTQKIPTEHYFQSLQYFIINPKLKWLYFVFYDPRVPAKDFFFITLERKDLEDEITKYHDEQIRVLQEVEKIVLELTF
jgi:putative phage-type endonuclease